MADESSIIINIHAQSDIDEATKQVADMLKAARDLAASSGQLKQANNTISTSFQQEADAANKSVQALRDAAKQENMLEKASASMRTELRKVNDQLRELAMTGDTSSETFLLLADRAAQMTDTMGDTQAIINILASDTKNLDTAIGVGAGLTGAFTAATSAMALLGGESEELNEAFLKVQAAMSILNGVQQVAAVLDKRSAVNVVLRTALTKLFTKEKLKEAAATTTGAAASTADVGAKTAEAAATNAATIATKGLTAALLANPFAIVLVAISAVVGAVLLLKKAFEDTGRSAEEMEAQYSHVSAQLDRMAKRGNLAARIAEAEGKSWQEVMAIRRNSLEAQATYADSKYMMELKKTQRHGHEITEEEKKYLDELLDQKIKVHQAISDLDDDYRVKEIEAQKKANQEAQELAKKRREQAIEEYEKELLTRQILEDVSKQSSPAKIKVELEVEDEEPEDIIDPATYREAMALKMQLEGASEDEIYQYKYNSLKNYLQARLAIEQEGSQAWLEINNELTELEIENADRVKEAQQSKYQQAMDIAQQALQSVADMTSEVFGIMNDQISAQLDNLHEMYTTDAEEAAKDEKKKYITKEEYDRKERDLKIKQAKMDKANAAFQIAISTAMAIMRIWADVPKVDFGATTIALTAMVSALGAVQLAAALAKPLPAYAKGRKGGKGEYAMVGERGAEIMYIPDGASIIPHNKINNPASWGAFGVPQLPMPAIPSTDRELMMAMSVMQATGQIDYDRMGEALAKHMPAQKAISVSIDRNGIMVSNGHDTHTHLNAKYSGAW